MTAAPVPPEPTPLETLLTAAELRQRVAELGAQIGADYDGLDPVLIGVLKGAFVFMADLVRAIPVPVEVDFMAVSSYGSSTRSSGVVRIVKDLDLDLAGRHVLLVEDIVDSGLTLAYLRKTLAQRDPASFEVCALMVREATLRVDVTGLRYIGFRIPDEWVVGYGLDVAQHWRNLPDIRIWRGDRA
jgi:hypoxanthine phosphoribosyltransferase